MPKGLPPTLFLTDPPYNIGHPYGGVDDRRSLEEYHELIRNVMCAAYEVAAPSAHFFMIHYPEALASMPAIARKIEKETDSSTPNGSWLSDTPMCSANLMFVMLEQG